MFNTVLVANRGEIAVRIMRTLRDMGIRSVGVFTEPDRESMHTRVADVAVCIGNVAAYLDVDAVIAAARASGAEAIHPGYGFLSENPSLATACADAGIAFIGPAASAIAAMGDKINAKALVSGAGVPVVPDCSDRDLGDHDLGNRDVDGLDDERLASAAAALGLPVLIKPTAGGGGKGMRRVDHEFEMLPAIAAARREAKAAFGNATLLVEKFIVKPRHIEIQVLADNYGTVVALGERECSLQRRHQKIIEETPSPLLDPESRSRMETAAVAAARACGYSGAGTIEFIVSGDSPRDFYFMEMNTRLQVEHPVTEMVRGIDLVEWQLRVAAGERLPWSDTAHVPAPRGHAVEARIYAEDPGTGFLPSAGRVLALQLPVGAGVRVDSALFEGQQVGTSYDPMLAKVVAWGEDRDQSFARMRAALATTAVPGLSTNVGFVRRLVGHPEVLAGNIDTALVERTLPDLVDTPDPGRIAAVGALVSALLTRDARAGDPWRADGWRLTGDAVLSSDWTVGPVEVAVSIQGDPGGNCRISWSKEAAVAVSASLEDAHGRGRAAVAMGGRRETFLYALDGDGIWLCRDGDACKVARVRDSAEQGVRNIASGGEVTSPMPGTVLAVHVPKGTVVNRGEPIVTVEAMKMEHVVAAPLDGTVSRVCVSEGQAVNLGQVLAEITVSGEG